MDLNLMNPNDLGMMEVAREGVTIQLESDMASTVSFASTVIVEMDELEVKIESDSDEDQRRDDDGEIDVVGMVVGRLPIDNENEDEEEEYYPEEGEEIGFDEIMKQAILTAESNTPPSQQATNKLRNNKKKKKCNLTKETTTSCICKLTRKRAPLIKCSYANCTYFIGRNNSFWEAASSVDGIKHILCRRCFNEHRNKRIISLPDRRKGIKTTDGDANLTIKVSIRDFKQKQNYEVLDEPTITCCRCARAFHRICVLYIPAPDENDASFVCEECRKGDDDDVGASTSNGQNRPLKARDILKCEHLQETPLSWFMEAAVNKLIDEMNLSAEKVVVRVLSNVTKTHSLPSKLKTFVEKFNVVGDFPYRSRLIMCFQNTKDGESFAFFTIYLEEYGEDCPLQNRHKAFIALLDSARLFQPSVARTQIYYAVLKSYFKYAALNLGITQVFIWACPPLTDDADYVFPRKPDDQLNPGTERLCEWYDTLGKQCCRDGIAFYFKSLIDWCPKTIKQFFSVFPYFADDYWPAEMVSIITTVEEEMEIVAGTAATTTTVDPSPNPVGALPFKKSKKKKGKKKAGLTSSSAPSSSSTTTTSNTFEEQVFEKILEAMDSMKASFSVMQLKRDRDSRNSASSRRGTSAPLDPVISTELANFREFLVDFFNTNNLEFGDIQQATFATKMILKEILFAKPLLCDSCMEPVFEGKSCGSCDFGICNACRKKKRVVHHHEHKNYLSDYLSHNPRFLVRQKPQQQEEEREGNEEEEEENEVIDPISSCQLCE